MTTECIASKLEFQELEGRRVEAEFNGGQITSDSGGLLLREVESRYGFEGVVKVHVATGSKWGDTLSCGYAEKHKERRCRRWKRPIGACRSLQKALNRTDGVRAISRRRLWALA